MMCTSANSTMEQLYDEFKRIGQKGSFDRETLNMIYEWGSQFFVEREDNFSDLLERWEIEAKQRGLSFPLFDEVSDAINHKAITPVKFFDYFVNLFILND